MAIPTIDKTFLGVHFKLQAGLYFFLEAAAFGEIGHTKFTEDWIEQKEKKNRVYTEFGNPAKIVLNAKIGLDPKIVLEAGDNITASISGKSFAYAELVNYNLLENKIVFPIIEDGFQLKCTPKAQLTFWDWSYTSQWDEYIYNVNW